MPIAVVHETGNVYRLEIGGRLTRTELAACESELAGALQAGGTARLLCVANGFVGWDGDGWQNLSFYVAHGDAIDRIAVVADERWRDELLMFAAAGLRRAPVEFFSAHDVARARAWLSE